MNHPVLEQFHPAVATWFQEQFPAPTPPQIQGWPLIAAGQNVLILAPTGSGKTLAAFLKCLDWLYQEAAAGHRIDDGVKVLYISPLKALNHDIHRNLELPLSGIRETAERMGMDLPVLQTAVRTGDTPSAERQRMLRRPPQILITTPESLFLLLSSQARRILGTVRYVIVDELHTVFANKRGAHLALSLERLEQLAGSSQPLVRIGLSATIRPLDEAAAFLGGNSWDEAGEILKPRPVAVVDAGEKKTWDLQMILPLPDLRELPEKSIWPPIYQKLLDMVRAHRTTLVFVNNRRQAERITANLNELAGKEIARTHHGSISREVRLEVERLLKSGELSCIVATASLELGIDVGSIDLVVQIESPKEVSRGLQRVGRAGHVVGLPSKGRIIPKTRADLLEAAAILREMRAGRVETSKAPRNCLDVLAQQLVAITATGESPVDGVYHLTRCAYNYRDLSRSEFENVLAMLSGSFSTREYTELKPRLYWNKDAGVIGPDPYGKRLVFSSGGTIPDRGYFGVYLLGSGVRLGELDEEFVFERRLNERFVLGTSLWKIEEIRQDRVIVSPARKGEAIVPFWKADQGGRPFELGQRIGAFLESAEARLEAPDFIEWLEEECGLTRDAALNLRRYLTDQKRALGFLPTHKRLVVEEFPDEVGEWRVVIHSPFGLRLHSALGLLVREEWQQRRGITVEEMASDDGIMFEFPGGDEPPRLPWEELPREGLEERLAGLVSSTPLFGAVFRQAAQLSLVMPRGGYGRKRNPLWLTRLKAGNLLQVVSKYRDFPLVVETYRQILQDYFDIAALREVLAGLAGGSLEVHTCRRDRPSPFAQGYLLNFVNSFMYESDTPKGERRLQLFGLGRDTLRALVGAEGFRELFTPEAVQAVARKAQGLEVLDREVDTERVRYWLERRGDVGTEELETLFPENAVRIREELQRLAASGQAVWIRRDPGGPQLVMAGTLRDEYLAALDDLRLENPVALRVNEEETNRSSRAPSALMSREEARRRIVERYLRTHGPFGVAEICRRYGFAATEVATELSILAAAGLAEPGEFVPGGRGEEWCSPELLREIHRRSLAQARKEIEPRKPKAYAVLVAGWQGVGCKRVGLEGLAETLTQLAGVWLPAADWEGGVFPVRVRDYRPIILDQLIASGQIGWEARGEGNNLKIRFYNTTSIVMAPDTIPVGAGLTEPGVSPRQSVGELSAGAVEILDLLRNRGALTLPQILQVKGGGTMTVWEVLEELVRAGRISNDSFGPVRYLLETAVKDRSGARGVLQPAVLARMGRWSLLPELGEMEREVRVEGLLNRYGMVCRETVGPEELSWGELYPGFELLENIGKARRGYFVEGLGGIQFAWTAAVERLRRDPEPGKCWALGWHDPANVVRIFPEWPGAEELLRATPDWVVYEAGEPVLVASGKKLKLQAVTERTPQSLTGALGELVRLLAGAYPDQKIAVVQWNGEQVLESPAEEVLVGVGFERGYRELTLWPSERNLQFK